MFVITIYVPERIKAEFLLISTLLLMIPVRSPNLNAYIESFHSILEDDCCSRYEFEKFAHTYKIIAETWIITIIEEYAVTPINLYEFWLNNSHIVTLKVAAWGRPSVFTTVLTYRA